jgi:hypothetical protein
MKRKVIGKLNARILVLGIVAILLLTKDRGMSVAGFSLKDPMYGTVLLAVMVQWLRAENQPSYISFLALISRGTGIGFFTRSNSWP